MSFDFENKGIGRLKKCKKCGFKHADFACLSSEEKIGLPLSVSHPQIVAFRRQEIKKALKLKPVIIEEKPIWNIVNKKYCFYCGNEEDYLTIDHIVAKNLGGNGTPWNKVPACKTCNQYKSNLNLSQFILLCDQKNNKVVHFKINYATMIKNINLLLIYKERNYSKMIK